MSIWFDIITATSALWWLLFSSFIFVSFCFQSTYVFLSILCVSYRQCTVGSWLLFFNPCILIGMFNPFMFKVINMIGFISIGFLFPSATISCKVSLLLHLFLVWEFSCWTLFIFCKKCHSLYFFNNISFCLSN